MIRDATVELSSRAILGCFGNSFSSKILFSFARPLGKASARIRPVTLILTVITRYLGDLHRNTFHMLQGIGTESFPSSRHLVFPGVNSAKLPLSDPLGGFLLVSSLVVYRTVPLRIL